MVYIRQDKLPKLKEYKYSAVDKSLVSRFILKPFYTHVVIKCFPLWMAPNLITLTGFIFVIINFLTMLWYTPTMDQDIPSWVYASWCIGLFLYQTFDAVDGTQARRTRQSGPLGELFDHGVDALNTTLEVLLFAAAMNFGQSWPTVLTLFASLLTFYVQTWDEYHTKTLTLGIVSGPVEGVLTLCIVYGITAIKGGGSFWQQSLLQTVGVTPKPAWLPDSLYTMAWNEWYMAYGGVVLVFNTFQSAQNVMKARANGTSNGQNHGHNPLLGLIPFFVAWTLIPTYLALNPVILRHHLIPFVFYVGLINAYSVGRMITAHLTKSRFPYDNVLILPLLWGVIDSIGPAIQDSLRNVAASRYNKGTDLSWLGWPSALGVDSVYQIAFVFMCVGMGIGVYGSFVVDVITTICDYLDIWCLTIKHPYNGEAEQSVEKTDRKKK